VRCDASWELSEKDDTRRDKKDEDDGRKKERAFKYIRNYVGIELDNI
jgi:hypothetical protein